jgi:hypothetical protein
MLCQNESRKENKIFISGRAYKFINTVTARQMSNEQWFRKSVLKKKKSVAKLMKNKCYVGVKN